MAIFNHPHLLIRPARPGLGRSIGAKAGRIGGFHGKPHIPGHQVFRQFTVDQTRDSLRGGPRRHATKKRRAHKREIKAAKATNKLLLKHTHKGTTTARKPRV